MIESLLSNFIAKFLIRYIEVCLWRKREGEMGEFVRLAGADEIEIF